MMAGTVDAEILALVHQAKRAAYETIGLDGEATAEQRRACQLVFESAIAAYEARRYRDSLRLLTKLRPMLDQIHWSSASAEVCVAIAGCYLHLRKRKAARAALDQAYALEPDNKRLREIAARFGMQPAGNV